MKKVLKQVTGSALTSAALVAMLTLGHSPLVHADVLLTLARISDTKAVLSVSGQLGSLPSPVGNYMSLELEDPFSTDPTESQNNSVLGSYSTVQAANSNQSVLLNYAFNAGSGFGEWGGTPFLYIGNWALQYLPEHSTLSGSVELILADGTTFSEIGAKGRVSWGAGALPENIVGSWQMVAPTVVPEPGSLALGSLALLAVFQVARRRQNIG